MVLFAAHLCVTELLCAHSLHSTCVFVPHFCIGRRHSDSLTAHNSTTHKRNSGTVTLTHTVSHRRAAINAQRVRACIWAHRPYKRQQMSIVSQWQRKKKKNICHPCLLHGCFEEHIKSKLELKENTQIHLVRCDEFSLFFVFKFWLFTGAVVRFELKRTSNIVNSQSSRYYPSENK